AGSAALSPDGTRLAFAGLAPTGHTVLYVQPLDGGSAQVLAGTEDAETPFWSPDSKSIAFFVPGRLKRIDAAGGPVQTIAPAPQGRGGTWSQSGVIVFSPSLSGP